MTSVPLPVLPLDISDQLARTRANIDLINNLLRDLSQPSDQPLSLDAFNSSTADIKHELIRLDASLDELEILADECEEDGTRSSALQIVQDHRTDAARLRALLRTTALDVKRRLSSAALIASRAELLRGAAAVPASRPANPDEALMSASTDVAQSLRHTLSMMKQELDRSVLSTHMLEQQTATLQLTAERYSAFGELMHTSRALIRALRRADTLDRILLGGALAVFGLVCLHILKKRILDRGIAVFSAAVAPLGALKQAHPAAPAPDSVITASLALASASTAALVPGLAPADRAARNPPAPQPAKPPLVEPSRANDPSAIILDSSPPVSSKHATQDRAKTAVDQVSGDGVQPEKDSSTDIGPEMCSSQGPSEQCAMPTYRDQRQDSSANKDVLRAANKVSRAGGDAGKTAERGDKYHYELVGSEEPGFSDSQSSDLDDETSELLHEEL